MVQTGNVEPGRRSVLILGDSFTEEKGYQPINGGILGTGFRQWILLHEYLKSSNIMIDKLIVVFISDDSQRPVWNFRPRVLQCLSDYRDCVGNEDFHGMPPDAQRQAFLERLRAFRLRSPDAYETLRNLLPATTKAYRQARRFAAAPEDSFDAAQIRYFSDRYGKNVVFVHLPDRSELLQGPEEPGVAVRKAVREAGAKFFDGFERCGLAIADYYVNDSHPNRIGYRKIANCVRAAAGEIM